MDVKELLQQIKDGSISIDEAERIIKRKPFEDMGFAMLDSHRKIRQGYGEVVFCSGKEDEYLLEIFSHLYKENGEVLGTRADKKQHELILKKYPMAEYDNVSKILKIDNPQKEKIGKIVVCSAGTADIPVAEEAAQVAEFFGNNVERVYDIGVSGLHRLLSKLEILQSANAIVAVAGMEGALPSVIGGLVSCPVIAVPTSIGYGANMNGISALLTMINSCANGVSVVNIDNGFGAGYNASIINRQTVKGR